MIFLDLLFHLPYRDINSAPTETFPRDPLLFGWSMPYRTQPKYNNSGTEKEYGPET